MPHDAKDQLSLSVLNEWFVYDRATGLFSWKKVASAHPVGSHAGMRHKYHIRLHVGGLSMLAHRAAWLICYERLPLAFLDHINGNGHDNRIDNLREATHSQNMMNKKIYKNNTSGFKGVSFDKESGRFGAYISIGGKGRRIGRYDTAELAHQAYRIEAAKSFGEFARFA